MGQTDRCLDIMQGRIRRYFYPVVSLTSNISRNRFFSTTSARERRDGIEPSREFAHRHAVLHFWRPHHDGNRPLATADVLHPLVVSEVDCRRLKVDKTTI